MAAKPKLYWVAWSGDQDPYDRDEYVAATPEEALDLPRIVRTRIDPDCYDTIEVEGPMKLRPLTYAEFRELHDLDWDPQMPPPPDGLGQEG